MKKPNKFYARVKRGAPTIFTVLSVAGVIATGTLSARAANKTRNTEESEKSTVDNFKEGWKNYIPAIAVTVLCIQRSVNYIYFHVDLLLHIWLLDYLCFCKGRLLSMLIQPLGKFFCSYVL